MIEKKIMVGLENIHVAKCTHTGYGTPILIEGAKSVEAELSYDYEMCKSGKRNVKFIQFVGGSGFLEVIGLTPEEYGLLFGNTVDGNRVTVKDYDVSKPMALMFSRRNSNGENIGYCIYRVTFRPIGISGKTLKGGSISEETIKIKFDIESNHDDIYYFDYCDDSFFDKVN